MANLRMVVIESDDASAVLPMLSQLFQPRAMAVVMDTAPLLEPATEAPKAIVAAPERLPADIPPAPVKRTPHMFKRTCDTCRTPFETAGPRTKTCEVCKSGGKSATSGDPTREAFEYVQECMKQKCPIDTGEVKDFLPAHYGDAETRRFIQSAMERARID